MMLVVRIAIKVKTESDGRAQIEARSRQTGNAPLNRSGLIGPRCRYGFFRALDGVASRSL